MNKETQRRAKAAILPSSDRGGRRGVMKSLDPKDIRKLGEFMKKPRISRSRKKTA